MNGENVSDRDGMAGALGRLQDHFERWRRQNGQGRRRRIPVDMWEKAAGLARHHGVFKVARTLRLDYNMLKERSGVKTARCRNQEAMPFVELMMPGPMAASESVIELTNRKGARMTIRLHPHCAKAMMELTEVFLRQRK